MKLKNPSLWLVSGLFIALTAQAHDVKEHMANGEKPKCAALENSDTAKMDADDSVVQAMIKKCMEQLHQQEQMHQDSGHIGNEHHGDSVHGDKEHSEHG